MYLWYAGSAATTSATMGSFVTARMVACARGSLAFMSVVMITIARTENIAPKVNVWMTRRGREVGI